MLAYDGSHILHTAIAYFDVVLVKKGVILVLSRKVFRYELKEDFADVSFHVAAEWRILPDNVTFAVSSWSSCLSMFFIGHAGLLSLWSFNVTKACRSAMHSALSSMWRLVAMFLASLLMLRIILVLAFCR